MWYINYNFEINGWEREVLTCHNYVIFIAYEMLERRDKLFNA